ncbi:hypothetical protein J4727_05040 [Providencia rettgeri]|uniref:Uncharacterized protein n=1 Tax=Providencia rettgeri TaxID=587 RepID=A0A939NBX3_PRORE|nr:hypothetical protein [Providencia rettgeri]
MDRAGDATNALGYEEGDIGSSVDYFVPMATVVSELLVTTHVKCCNPPGLSQMLMIQ